MLNDAVAGPLTALLPTGELLPNPGFAIYRRPGDARLPLGRLPQPRRRSQQAVEDSEVSARSRPKSASCSSATPKLDGRSVARLRAIDRGDSCLVEAEVFPRGATSSTHVGPYTFADVGQATAFVTEAMESLLYLGCEVFAQ